MDIHKELARIFAKATPKEWVDNAEKSHDEVAAHCEDELRLIVASLEAARRVVRKVCIAANLLNIPIDQMLICAEDCLTESIDETYRKLSNT